MKKTKKIIAIMAAFMLATTSVFAGEAANDTEILTEMANESYTKTVMYGTFKSFEDGQVLLNDGKRDFAINTDENTLFVNSDAAVFDITSAEKDTEFEIIADTAQTRSIPPQSYGYVLIAKTSEKSPIYVEAAEINDSEIVSADGEYIIRIPDTAEITAFGSGTTLTANDIKKDSKLFVYSDIMTMSIPAQVPADKIVVLDASDISEEEVSVSSYNKTVMSGTLKSFEDGQILLNDGKRDFAVNTDENTVFTDSGAKKFNIKNAKAGTEFEIIADTAQTRSIPPQSYGYVVIAKTSEKMPLYVETAETNDSEIVSADGEYIVRIPDTAEIKAFGTGKTLTKNDIKKGSQLFVYSEIMTMSIPAQVIADSIVVLDADTESNEQTDVKPGTIPGIKPGMSHEEIAQYIFRLIKLLGFENIFSK